MPKTGGDPPQSPPWCRRTRGLALQTAAFVVVVAIYFAAVGASAARADVPTPLDGAYRTCPAATYAYADAIGTVRASCGSARRLIRLWDSRWNRAGRPVGASDTRVRGFLCHRFAGQGEGLTTLCQRGSVQVGWYPREAKPCRLRNNPDTGASSLEARSVSCLDARRVVRAWERACSNALSRSDSCRIRIKRRAYRCTARFEQGPGPYNHRVECPVRRGGGFVRFGYYVDL